MYFSTSAGNGIEILSGGGIAHATPLFEQNAFSVFACIGINRIACSWGIVSSQRLQATIMYLANLNAGMLSKARISESRTSAGDRLYVS